MGQYKAKSTNSRNFSLTNGNSPVGELTYAKWYSFNAEIQLADNSTYQFEPTGFWNSKIELKKAEEVLLGFEMGWYGIILKTKFSGNTQNYLLKTKGLLSSKFVLVDEAENELLVAETDFVWSKLRFDYTIDTSMEFDRTENKEIMLLTILHCINYYLTIISAAA